MALKRGAVELAPLEEIEIVPAQAGGRATERYRLSRGELRVAAGECESERVLLMDELGKTRRVKVCRSGGAGSLAALEIVPARPGAFPLHGDAHVEAGPPRELTAMRLVGAVGTGRPQWEMVRLEGEVLEEEIRLTEPIDRSALGSPLLLDGTPLGVVLHENGGLRIGRAGKAR